MLSEAKHLGNEGDGRSFQHAGQILRCAQDDKRRGRLYAVRGACRERSEQMTGDRAVVCRGPSEEQTSAFVMLNEVKHLHSERGERSFRCAGKILHSAAPRSG